MSELNRRQGMGLLAGLAGATAAGGAASHAGRARWVGVWGAVQQKRTEAPTLAGQTVAQAAVLSAGGSEVRVRLVNLGAKPLSIGAASVRGGAPMKVMFGGLSKIVVPPGAPVISDPVKLMVRAGDALEVRLFLPEPTVADTQARTPDNKGARVSPPGDFTASGAMAVASELPPLFLHGIEVLADPAPPALVILGDTKSAGPGTWPEMFAAKAAGRLSVVNRSQYAGLMQLGAANESAIARFDADVLSVPGARDVLIFTGNNDLIQPGTAGSNGRVMMDPSLAQSVEQLTAGLAQLAARARAAGLRPVAGTWLPYAGVAIPGYSAPEKLAKRDRVNAWIRSSKTFDLVIDFDAALRDPADPQKLRADYDSGNHFTPSPAGYKAMAEAAAKTYRL